MGSEMCIRDRRQTVGQADEAGAPEIVQPGESAAERQDKEQRGVCLLYTSDAADERSSVDLGGRRIIKKKKYIALDR